MNSMRRLSAAPPATAADYLGSTEGPDRIDEATADRIDEATEQRDQLGQAFGDVYRISWGRIKAGKMQAINATTYD
jgi:hypothetical protein